MTVGTRKEAKEEGAGEKVHRPDDSERKIVDEDGQEISCENVAVRTVFRRARPTACGATVRALASRDLS